MVTANATISLSHADLFLILTSMLSTVSEYYRSTRWIFLRKIRCNSSFLSSRKIPTTYFSNASSRRLPPLQTEVGPAARSVEIEEPGLPHGLAARPHLGLATEGLGLPHETIHLRLPHEGRHLRLPHKRGYFRLPHEVWLAEGPLWLLDLGWGCGSLQVDLGIVVGVSDMVGDGQFLGDLQVVVFLARHQRRQEEEALEDNMWNE